MTLRDFTASNSLASSILPGASIQPSLVLDFSNGRSLDARVTFTRASTGTFVGTGGLIKTAAQNVPRFEHDPLTAQCLGLLTEPSTTNSCRSSEDLRPAANGNTVDWWLATETTMTQNVGISPTGQNTACKVAASGGNVSHFVAHTSVVATAGQTHTCSVFLKAAELTTAQFGFVGVDGYALIFVFLDTGVLGSINQSGGWTDTSVSIKNYGNGWYRCSLTSTCSGTDVRMRIWPGTGAEFDNDGAGVLAWGTQVELNRKIVSSYIPTASASVTRASEEVSLIGTNFSSWYNQKEGTLVLTTFVDGLGSISTANPPRPIGISNGTNDNRFFTWSDQMSSRIGGVTVGTTTPAGVGTSSGVRIWAYKDETGGGAFMHTSMDTPAVSGAFQSYKSMSEMVIGGNSPTNISGRWGGPIAKIVYFARRLSNNELKAIV